MTYEELSRLRAARPFVPFILHTTDGRAFYVDDPLHTSFNYERKILSVSDGRRILARLELDVFSHAQMLQLSPSV